MENGTWVLTGEQQGVNRGAETPSCSSCQQTGGSERDFPHFALKFLTLPPSRGRKGTAEPRFS